MKLIHKVIATAAVATTATLTTLTAKVQAASFTLPIGDAANATGVTAARDLFGLDGTGIKIGVISDSFNTSEIAFTRSGQVDNYAYDIANGYLPEGIQVLKDFADPSPGVEEDGDPIDEGRAMLELIHAIAPGASLAFYATQNAAAPTATPEDLQDYANGIQSLAAAGANIIVDDIGFYNDPFPPDGPINQAISNIFNQGVSYFSAAGNDYPDFPVLGHTNNPDAAAVAAVYYGPFPVSPRRARTPQGQLEPFSSAGSPPYNKPDFAAPDGLEISFNLAQAFPLDTNTGLYPFFGTSAAAPYAAAVAALLLQADPGASPGEVYAALRNTAQPLPGQAQGYNNRSGYGLIQADKAIASLGVQPKGVPEPSEVPLFVAMGILVSIALLKRHQRQNNLRKAQDIFLAVQLHTKPQPQQPTVLLTTNSLD